jgi:hypothetical protein
MRQTGDIIQNKPKMGEIITTTSKLFSQAKLG